MKAQTINAIHSLITIHADRSKGYQVAAFKTNYQDLRELFSYISQQSRLFTEELKKCISDKNSDADNVLLSSNKDAEFAHSGDDRLNILSSCEFREDSAKRSYEEILQQKKNIPGKIYNIISRHRNEISQTHGKVRSLYFSL